MTCTRSPYVLDSLKRLSPPGTPRDSLRLSRCLIEATSIFTMPEALWPHFSGYPRTRCPRALVLTALGHERRPVGPTALAGMRPLTPLSRAPLCSSRSRHLRAWSRVLPHVLMISDDAMRVGRVRNPPRPPSPPAREDQRLQMIRGAFHRQGPFVGSGGLYSPGPATAAPLLAMLQPLDDALTSPWAFSRSRAVVVRLESRCDSSLRSTRSPTFDRRRSPRPRPPFARP
jgi:hypothetical protein